MSRISQVTYELNYNWVPEKKLEFQTAIRGHHICKDIWVPSIGQNLVCKTGTRKEAIKYDKNAIGIFKSGDNRIE